jgi:hypothetical protein
MLVVEEVMVVNAGATALQQQHDIKQEQLQCSSSSMIASPQSFTFATE